MASSRMCALCGEKRDLSAYFGHTLRPKELPDESDEHTGFRSSNLTNYCSFSRPGDDSCRAQKKNSIEESRAAGAREKLLTSSKSSSQRKPDMTVEATLRSVASAAAIATSDALAKLKQSHSVPLSKGQLGFGVFVWEISSSGKPARMTCVSNDPGIKHAAKTIGGYVEMVAAGKNELTQADGLAQIRRATAEHAAAINLITARMAAADAAPSASSSSASSSSSSSSSSDGSTPPSHPTTTLPVVPAAVPAAAAAAPAPVAEAQPAAPPPVAHPAPYALASSAFPDATAAAAGNMEAPSNAKRSASTALNSAESAANDDDHPEDLSPLRLTNGKKKKK